MNGPEPVVSLGAAPELRWSVTLPTTGGGSVTALPDGFLITGPQWIAEMGPDGAKRWTAPARNGPFDPPVVIDDDAFAAIEDGAVVVRGRRAGGEAARWAAPRSSTLAAAPWGDLVYSQVADDFTATVQCVDRMGRRRWSVPLTGVDVVHHVPFAVGDAVVVARRGGLWAYDAEGEAAWVAGLDGVRVPPEVSEPTPDERCEPAGEPLRVDADRVLVELSWHGGHRLVELDGLARRMTTVVNEPRMRDPYALLTAGAGYRVAGRQNSVDIGHMDYRYPVLAVDPGGEVAWRHLLEAPFDWLAPAPGGAVVVAGTPTVKRWRDYGRWQDLSAETFVRYLDAAGEPVWTWYAPGLITHLPAVAADGTVLVGSEGRLFALSSPQRTS